MISITTAKSTPSDNIQALYVLGVDLLDCGYLKYVLMSSLARATLVAMTLRKKIGN
jgi:hypothetical protein